MKLKNPLIIAMLLIITIMLLPIYVAKAETLMWTGDVSSSGATTTGPVLYIGWHYRIEASEIFWYNAPDNLIADAQYYVTHNPYAWHPAPDGHSFLQINELDQNWGPLNGAHTYSIAFDGNGEAVRFRIVDWVDGGITGNYSNNYCHLPVSIYLVERAYGHTPGFWKKHLGVWPPPYTPETPLADVFGSQAPGVTLLTALDLKGGSGISGAKETLARTATAALLSSIAFEGFGAGYPVPTGELITEVTNAFNSNNRDVMLSLASELNVFNNYGPPLGWP